MKKKYGPLQLYQWLLIGAATGIIYYIYKARQANAASVNPAIDPLTGVPYAQEQGSNGLGPVDPTTGQPYALEALGNQSNAGGTAQNGGPTTLEQELGDLEQIIGLFSAIGELPTSTGASAGSAAGSSGASTVSTTTGTKSGSKTSTKPPANPWTTVSGFFSDTLSHVSNTYRSAEATARYLYSKGYRPLGQTINPNTPGAFKNEAGTSWVYVGPKGKSTLSALAYGITSSGGATKNPPLKDTHISGKNG